MSNDDQKMIAELKAMARIYQRLGKNAEALQMLDLVRSMEMRLQTGSQRKQSCTRKTETA